MDQELQTTDTDASAGEGDVSSEVVSQLKELTGRDFKDVEDFKKHYTNLSSFVGKKDEAGEKLKSILSKAEPYAAKYGLPPDKFLEYYLTNPSATEDDIRNHFQAKPQTPQIDDELHSKVKKLEFIIENPEAKNEIKLIETLAKGLGVSYEEAYNSPEFKKVSNASRETSGTSVINSNSKIAMSASDLDKAKKKLYERRTIDAVAEYLKEAGIVDDGGVA